MGRPKKTPTVVRTSQGLKSLLFDEIGLLRSGKITAARANGTARLAGQIVATAKLEIEFQRFNNDMASLGVNVNPKGITL